LDVCIPGIFRVSIEVIVVAGKLRDIIHDVSQILAHADHFYGDPQYSWDDYIQA
jgi:hypothetical protein